MSSLKFHRWLLLVGLLIAQPGVVPELAVRAADPTESARNLASAARPITNEAAQRTLQQISNAIRAGEFAQARTELRRLLDSDATDGVVPIEAAERAAKRYESVVDATLQLLNLLPIEERQRFIQQREPQAHIHLREVLRHGGSDAELREIADRFPGTASGRQAKRLLVSRFLDREQFWQARAVLRNLQREGGAAGDADAALTSQLRQIETLEAELQNASTSTVAEEIAASDPPSWQAAAAFEDSSVGWFQQALDEHRRQAIPVLPRLNPVVSGHTVIARTLNRLFAVELTTGRPQWQAESAATGSQRPSRAALTGTLESLAAVSMARQVQLDTTYSRMVVDEGRVLCLEYVSGLGRSLSGADQLNGEGALGDPRPQNQLIARSVTDGRIDWTRPAFVEDAAGFASARAYFLGVPAVQGDSLVGLLQHDAELFVYALDRHDGTPHWMLKIGERDGTAAADSDWTSIACPVVSVDGLLICSTGAGLLVAVDPIFRRVVWARRYSRADEPPAGSPLPGAATRLTRRWWAGWREITLLSSPTSAGSATLLYAGPDVPGVCVLDAHSGEEQMRVSASQPLFLQTTGPQPDAAPLGLLVARHSLTAFDPVSGVVAWTRSIPEPIGRGFFTETSTSDSVDADLNRHYLFPATDGTTRLVRLSDGQVEVGRAIDAGAPKTWTLSADGVVEQTFEDLQLLPAPAIGADGTPQWSSGSGSGTGTGTGNEDALLSAIRQTDSGDALRELVMHIGLTRPLDSRQPDTPDAGGKNEFDRPGVIHTVAAVQRARELQADSLAFDLLLSLSARNPNGAISSREAGPARIVRYDRWIQGQLTDLLTTGDTTETDELRKQFAAAVDTARTSRDPFALSRLIERLREVPGISAAEAQPDGRVGRSFLQNEIALLRLASANDSAVAADATKQLVELYLAHSYQQDAAAVVANHARNRSSKTSNAARTSLLPADQSNALLAAGRQSDWKAATPRLAERPDRFSEVRYFPIPVESQQGTLFERLNVAVRLVGKSGSSLRFYGDGQAGYWKLELPASESALHTWFTLPRGWGIGRLLILRIGTELYGITPYSDSGEPRAQVRWTLDMADGNRLSTHQLAYAVPGFGAEDLTPLDGFDRPMAQVGPVQAGYLCYRDRGLLVCLDPETGQQLWTRAEVQPEMRCVGDEQSIWLIDESVGEVTQLSATDGTALYRFSLLEMQQSDADSDLGTGRLLVAQGRRWLLGWPRDDLPTLSHRRLAVIDAQTQRVIWSLETNGASAVFTIGHHWFGVLNRNGQLEIHDVKSGGVVASHQVEHPARLRSAHCTVDSHSHIVALSTEVDAGFQAVGEPRFGYRTPLINGLLIAISAHDGSLLWQQPIHGERLLLDQPRSLPLLTLTSRPNQGGQTGHALRLVDRRNGQTLMRRKSADQFTPFTFDPNAALQRVVIRFSRSALRLDYDGS